MSKETIAAETSVPDDDAPPVKSAVRIEESLERFLTLHLPDAGNRRLEIKPLWTFKTGAAFFRCNYWTVSDGSKIKLERTLFVKVQKNGSEKFLMDITSDK